MKRFFTIIAALCMLCLTACEDATEVFNPNSDYRYKQKQFTTLAGQFEYIWTGLNNSYLFWYAETADWDAVRDEYLPKFQELDELGKKGLEVKDDTIKSLMSEIASMLLDKHLVIYMSNPYKNDGTFLTEADIDLSSIKENGIWRIIAGDSYYKENLTRNYQVSNFEEMQYNVSGTEHNVYSCVIDGSIPFLHISNYYVTTPEFCGIFPDYLSVVDNFFDNVRALSSQHKLKGVVIDNRFNSGGGLSDLELFVQTFSSTPVEVFRHRTKTGLGKYDYSPWIPYKVNPNPGNYIDINNAPIVVLQDMYSASAGELVGHALSLLPNTYIIGEVTRGAHGDIIQGSATIDGVVAGLYDVFYSGSFNVDSLDYCIKTYGGAAAVRTAMACNEIKNRHTGKYELREGKGIEPDEYVKFDETKFVLKAGDNQLEAALNYIRKKNR